MKPWRPIDEMGHDELRRYAQELTRKWAGLTAYDEEIQAHLREAAERMEKLGMESIRRVGHADRQE